MLNSKFIYKSDKFKKLQINCKEASRLLSEQLDHPLPWHKRILLAFHLSVCEACLYFGNQMKSLKNIIGKKSQSEEAMTPPTDAKLSNETLEKIKESLKKTASGKHNNDH